MTGGKQSAAEPQEGANRKGAWKHVQPEEILAYRRENGISRARLAAALGVSATSIQNWEGGRPAALRTQRRIRSLIDGQPLPTRSARPVESSKDEDCVVTVTGQIVAAYLANAELEPAQVTELIRNIKQALRE